MRRTWVALVAVLVACDPQARVDAGPPGGDAGGEVARVRVTLALGEGELPADWHLEGLRMYLGEARANNDRGGAMEPVWAPRQNVELGEVSRELEGVPATYGGLTLRGNAGMAPTLEIDLGIPEGDRLELVSTEPYEIALRCEGGPVRLSAAAEITLRARIAPATLIEALIAAPLPPAEDGVVHVDQVRAPEAVAAAEQAFLDGWTLDCEVPESSASTTMD